MSEEMKDFMIEYLKDVDEAKKVLTNNFPSLSE